MVDDCNAIATWKFIKPSHWLSKLQWMSLKFHRPKWKNQTKACNLPLASQPVMPQIVKVTSGPLALALLGPSLPLPCTGGSGRTSSLSRLSSGWARCRAQDGTGWWLRSGSAASALASNAGPFPSGATTTLAAAATATAPFKCPGLLWMSGPPEPPQSLNWTETERNWQLTTDNWQQLNSVCSPCSVVWVSTQYSWVSESVSPCSLHVGVGLSSQSVTVDDTDTDTTTTTTKPRQAKPRDCQHQCQSGLVSVSQSIFKFQVFKSTDCCLPAAKQLLPSWPFSMAMKIAHSNSIKAKPSPGWVVPQSTQTDW